MHGAAFLLCFNTVVQGHRKERSPLCIRVLQMLCYFCRMQVAFMLTTKKRHSIGWTLFRFFKMDYVNDFGTYNGLNMKTLQLNLQIKLEWLV